MIVVASTNGMIGMPEAMRILRGGGSAMDAVEAGIRIVEDYEEDHGVGYGGWPNLLGQMEFDASIMDGRTLGAGAVGALRGHRHPITVARKVMEMLPHVLLVGEGAARFAREAGSIEEDVLSPLARQTYEEVLRRHMSEEIFRTLADQADLCRWCKITTDPESGMGTVNFIAQDAHGDICTGVSTAGWAWKYPGRLGDSPLIGAGNYADNRYGAAACTGMGEMSIRCATAHSVVLYMKMGMSLDEAGRTAMEDLKALHGDYISHMNIVSIDHAGNPGAFSNLEGKTYAYMSPDMDVPLETPRVVVPMEKRWG